MKPETGSDAAATIPSDVIDQVVDDILALPEDDLFRRFEALADSQPNLFVFITTLSRCLPSADSFQAGLTACAIVWMYERHMKQKLPVIGVSRIKRCLESNHQSFQEFRGDC